MSVELKVTLVGEDPRQQEAFNNPASVMPTAAVNPQPTPTPQPSATASSQSNATAPITAITANPTKSVAGNVKNDVQQSQSVDRNQQQSPLAPIAPASKADASPWGQMPVTQENDLDGRLIDSIEALIAAIDKLTYASNGDNANHSTNVSPKAPVSSSPAKPSSATSSNWFDQFSTNVNRKIDELGFGNTAIGRMVSDVVSRVSGLGTQVSRIASNVWSGWSGTSAATAAGTTGAASRVVGAAGGSAAATGVGSTATAGTAASAMLTRLGLVAGAAATSMEVLMESVNKIAKGIEDLSPELSVAKGQHQMKMDLLTMDRAKRIGGDVAQLEIAQHKTTEAMYELQTKMYSLMLKLSPLIEGSLDTGTAGVRMLDTIASAANHLMAKFTDDPADDAATEEEMRKAVREFKDALWEIIGGRDDKAEAKDKMDPMFKGFLFGEGPVPDDKNAMPPNRGNGIMGDK